MISGFWQQSSNLLLRYQKSFMVYSENGENQVFKRPFLLKEHEIAIICDFSKKISFNDTE